MFDRIKMVFETIHQEDDYYEDDSGDYGREIHTLKGDWRVSVEEAKSLKEAQRMIKDCGEVAADNPPYSNCHFVIAWDADTKIRIPKHYLLDRGGED